MEIIVKEFIKSGKLSQILIKLLNPQILFCKSQTSLQIQELSLNPEKYFANPKKYFVTCYLRQQSASVRVCFRHFSASKMAEFCLLFDTCGSKVNLGDNFCFKWGSKVAEISHSSSRISTPEDEHASSSSSTK